MTNIEFAAGLRQLADVYDQVDASSLKQPIIGFYLYSKDDLLAIIRAVGGTWSKQYKDDWCEVISSKTSLLVLRIPRDEICERVVTWKCTPFLSPEEETEVDQALEA